MYKDRIVETNARMARDWRGCGIRSLVLVQNERHRQALESKSKELRRSVELARLAAILARSIFRAQRVQVSTQRQRL